jgi:hypothetical protein
MERDDPSRSRAGDHARLRPARYRHRRHRGARADGRRTRVAAKKVPCSTAVRACVRLSTNQAWLLSDGEVVAGPVPISHGRKGFATPTGSFRVSFKNEDHVSSIYDQAMPYSVFFNGGIAFHQGRCARSRTGAST